MPEGLSATEVGKEIGEHARRADGQKDHTGRDRLISISEALLLSVVTIVEENRPDRLVARLVG